MSYIEDFATGYGITSGARHRKQDREDKIEQEKLRKQFELDRDAEKYRQDKYARDAGFDNQTNQRIGSEDFTREQTAGSQQFQSGERVATQTHQSGERVATQTHQSDESKLNRDASLAADLRKLKQGNKQFSDRLDFDQQNMGLMAGFKARDEEARLDPNNPATQLNAERLAKLKRENAEATGAFTTPPGPTPANPRKALTPQDAQALAWAKANPHDPRSAETIKRLSK